MDDRIVRCGIISSCQSAATSKIVKALLITNLTRVSSAIASAGRHLDFLIHYCFQFSFFPYFIVTAGILLTLILIVHSSNFAEIPLTYTLEEGDCDRRT